MPSNTVVKTHSYPAHQFDDPGQQRDASALGTWVFLATEVLFLGAVFLAFFVYRVRWHEAFAEGARELKWQLGTLNTAVLLTSSYCMALAVHFARSGDRKNLIRLLLLTILLGAAFLGVKFLEYVLEYRDHLIPALNYSAVSPRGETRAPHGGLFMTFYFLLTGLHALHMLVGIGALMAVTWMAYKRRFSAKYFTPVEMVGLYWHFVDLVWVFLFPTLYLLRH